MAFRFASVAKMGVAASVVGAIVASCAYKPGITTIYTDPDGNQLKVWVGWPTNLPPGSNQVGTTPEGVPIYVAPDGSKWACTETIVGMKCAPFEITGTLPGGGGFPYQVIEPSRTGSGGGSTGVPPIDENGEGTPFWTTIGGGVLDQENDMATFTLSTSSLLHWPDEAPFDVTVSQAGGETTVSGSTNQVASYLAEAGVRHMQIPADGLAPALHLEFRVNTLTPILASNNTVLGYINFDVLYTRYASDMSLVPEQYHPIRPLGRAR